MLSFDVDQEIEQALTRLEEQFSPSQCVDIRRIVRANQQRGRVGYFMAQKEKNSPAQYVERVAQCYAQSNPYLRQLQVEKDSDVWDPLMVRLQKWCYHFLLHKGFVPGEGSLSLAHEYATEAAMALLHAYFPYDTAFDPWAVTIVQNICRKHLRDDPRHQVNHTLSLDDEQAMADESNLHINLTQNIDLRHDLMAVIQQLKEPYRQIITLFYFEQLSPAAIAARLGETQNTIYRLKFEALRELRKNLVQNGYK